MNLLPKISICAMHISLISQERSLGSHIVILTVGLMHWLLYMRGLKDTQLWSKKTAIPQKYPWKLQLCNLQLQLQLWPATTLWDKRSTNVVTSWHASGESTTPWSHYEATEKPQLLGSVLPSKVTNTLQRAPAILRKPGAYKQGLYRFCHTEPVFHLFLPLLMPSACWRCHRAIHTL